MLKKILMTALLLTGFAYADNFYVGGGIGLSSLNSKEITSIPDERHDLGGFGFIGGGFAGYNLCFCNNLDLGLEGFIYGNTSENKVFHFFNSTNLKVSSRYNAGVRILPGYIFCNNVEAHFIVGYSYGRFSAKDGGVYGSLSKHFHSNGYQLGFGTSIFLPCHTTLRFDAIYTGYSEHSLTGIANTTGLADTYKFRPRNLDGTISLIYNF